MTKLKDKAREYLRYGLSVIPMNKDKTPLSTWAEYQTKPLEATTVDKVFTGAKGIGIICGAVSGDLEVIDVDCKYDITGSLWEDYSTLLQENLPETYGKLVIATTVHNGYHIYYKCKELGGNVKLANRPTTEQERQETYQKEKANGALNTLARITAEKDKQKVLIETRGKGGYIIAPPTEGYTYIQGEPLSIPIITTEERGLILNIARSFNELPEPEPKAKTTSSYPSGENSPLEDYNRRGDVVELLERNGWKIVSQRGERIHLLRPGQTDSKTSGNFHTGLRTLRVFSSSSEFDPDKAYSPSQVFTLLECNGDNSQAYHKLLDLGYGKPLSGDRRAKTQLKTERIRVEEINTVNRVISKAGDTLRVEDITGDEILITSPGAEATDEVLKALEIIPTGKRVYISEAGKEIRSYFYRLNSILGKYSDIQKTESRGLTDREVDSLKAEIVDTGCKIQEPLDRDVYKKRVINALGGFGFTEESYQLTIDKLTTTRDKEAQGVELDKLLSKVQELRGRGETPEALRLIYEKSKEVRLIDKATEFSNLLKPVKEDELKERQAQRPPSLGTEYIIDGEELVFPTGALHFIAAPTSHGKTTMLINLALRTAEKYKDKEVYLFSYEEERDSVLMKALNTYQGKDISKNNRKSIQGYFSSNSTQYIGTENRGSFEDDKDKFFTELIDTNRLNINYINYNSETLIEAIRYIHKNAKPVVILIDYVQLLTLPPGKYKTYSRQEELKVIGLDLKDLAVETGLPIIMGAQFNRTVVNHFNLQATNIGEAGDIERVANVVLGLWNNDFEPGGTDVDKKEINKKDINIKGTIYSKILKSRNGRVGREQNLSYNGNTGVIGNTDSSSGRSFMDIG